MSQEVHTNAPVFLKKVNDFAAQKQDKTECRRLEKELHLIAFQAKFPFCSTSSQALRTKGFAYIRWQRRYRKEIQESVLDVLRKVEMSDSCRSYLQHCLERESSGGITKLQDASLANSVSRHSETSSSEFMDA